MNAWEFASSALWPIVVMIAVLILRRPLAELVRNVRHASLPGGVEFDVGRLEEAAEEAIAAEPAQAQIAETVTSEATTPESTVVTPDVAALASLSPAAVVMNSWRTIESALRRLYEAAFPDGTSGHSRPGQMAMISALHRQQYISEPTFTLLQELRRLRNAVAHEDEEPHVGASLAYAESADIAVRLLDLTAAAIQGRS
ncbi:hypothetical protein FHT40_006320 [Mycolicibacterium sp. BK556]|uniref:hypothetical protein n=1 Tax=unclassified Mycolicibacterium TaxID=2636767 RepID=UPI00161C09B5|nr:MULTISPECIES: hypothetical protein [unclassified Mycolicibacterium]MBB3606629.1 hypothetical protein [Mycolicibacterium sp. BK556]MBB3636124.1 hypothetical protein [Mycolicibacterium sp. BK607]